MIMSLPAAYRLTAKCNLVSTALRAVTRFRSFGDERTCITLLPFHYFGSQYANDSDL